MCSQTAWFVKLELKLALNNLHVIFNDNFKDNFNVILNVNLNANLNANCIKVGFHSESLGIQVGIKVEIQVDNHAWIKVGIN